MNTISDYLEFSPFDNKISGEFLKDIPENSSEPDKPIDEENEFWDRFFFKYSENQYENTIATLKSAIGESNRHYILFVGPSGSGKTTFLNYLIKNKHLYFDENLAIDMTNLIKIATSAEIKSNLLHEVLDAKILEYLNETVVTEISKNLIMHDKKELSWDVKWLTGSEYDDHELFYNFIGYCRNRFSKSRVRSFCRSIKDISDKITLYFISFIFNQCLKEKKPCVFVFDNLDELEQTYLVESLNFDLLTSFSKAQEFFKKIVLIDKYPFVSKCTLMVSVRRNFVATVNSCQFIERVEERAATIRFDSGYKQNLFEIFEKRVRMFQAYQNTIHNDGTWSAKNFNISTIEIEKPYIERLCRLFNLDYRITLSSLADALGEEIVTWGNIAAKDSDCRLGIRGFLLFYVLKRRLKNNMSRFSKYVDDELSRYTCNRNRMYFSLLTNMYEDEEGGAKKKRQTDIVHVSLLEFTNRVKLWYEDVSVKSMYETLFVSGYHNYSLPASLEGDTINNYLREEKYNVSLQSLCNYVAELYTKDKDELSNVEIVVNPLCSEYTRHVFIHYEYFNLLSVANERNTELLYGAKSLFQHETKEQIKSCMDKVFEMTQWVVNKADNHVCQICHKGCDNGKKNDCSGAIKILQDNGFLIQNNILYTSRVITSHINYLDSFRKFLWNKLHEKSRTENAELQKCVVEVIERYVDLYRKKQVENRAADVVMKSIEENILFAKNKGYDVWTPIKIGLGSNEE